MVISGSSIRIIAEIFGVSLGAINRHKAHIATKIANTKKVEVVNEIIECVDLIRIRDEVIQMSLSNVHRAAADGSITEMSGAVLAFNKLTMDQAKLTGELEPNTIQVNTAIQINIEEEVRKIAHLVESVPVYDVCSDCEDE